MIDKDGNTVVGNKIWQTPEGKGLDHAAVQPHTAGRRARSCESCHNNPKALGYGIEDGQYLKNYDQSLVVDLETATGEVIPATHRLQSQRIPGLNHDLSQIVNRSGEQLVSVGSHWPLTGPLPGTVRRKIERTGLCMGCHKDMADDQIWSLVSSPGWADNDAHRTIMNQALREYARSKSSQSDSQ